MDILARPKSVASRVLTVEIISDVICPWCYVGKRRLEESRELLGQDLRIEARWQPFQLNPSMPKEGVDRRTYRLAKFGSWERSQALDAQVAAAGREVGLTFRHDLMARTPNTFDAHRLIRLAGQEGVQGEVVEALFSAYFVEGRDIGDHTVLTEIAERAGIPRERAEEVLHGSEGAAEVAAEEAEARRQAVSGVPTFAVGGTPVFSGAVRAEIIAARLLAAANHHVG
jgi:predicted DsbA family dithiol-disulfide isomerase